MGVGPEQFGGADNFYIQEATVGIEVQDDVAAARTFYDDVLNDRLPWAVACEIEVSHVCFSVVLESHEPIRPWSQ